MNDRPPAPDPEIPDEIRSKLASSKRPGGFSPKSLEAEADNPQEGEVATAKTKDLRKFFQKLKEVIKKGKFFRVEQVERDVEDPETKEWTRKKYVVKIPVELTLGEDGLPYPAAAVTSQETRRVRELQYPDAPKMDKSLGDLTPDFVEWLYLTHPYDAAVRYYSRTTHVQSWAMAHLAA